MKKKIVAFALVACLAMIAIAGASLAYFTDTDEKINAFTSGKVDITLNEVFDAETAQLIPGVEIQKDVTISLSNDSVETYVWYTYAIPANNAIHVNHAGRNLLEHRDNKAYWTIDQTKATDEKQCWIINDTAIEQVEVDGILYNVYVVLYNGTLTAGEETTIGMTKVYCDTKVDFDNETENYTMNGQNIGFDLNNVKIIVTAYGIQAATFGSVQEAYAAYTAQMNDIPSNAVDID